MYAEKKVPANQERRYPVPSFLHSGNDRSTQAGAEKKTVPATGFPQKHMNVLFVVLLRSVSRGSSS